MKWKFTERLLDLEIGVRERPTSRLLGLDVSSARIETLARYGICKGLFLRSRYGSLI